MSQKTNLLRKGDLLISSFRKEELPRTKRTSLKSEISKGYDIARLMPLYSPNDKNNLK